MKRTLAAVFLMWSLAGCETLTYLGLGGGLGFGAAKVFEKPHTVNNFDGNAKQVVDTGGGWPVNKILIISLVLYILWLRREWIWKWLRGGGVSRTWAFIHAFGGGAKSRARALKARKA